MEGYTTIQMSLALNNRIKQLAEKQAKHLGLNKLSQAQYLEMVVTEKEKQYENQSTQTEATT